MEDEIKLNLYAYRISETDSKGEKRVVIYDKGYYDATSNKEFKRKIEEGKLIKEHLRRYPNFSHSQISLLSANIPNLYNKHDIFVGYTLLGIEANFKGNTIDDLLDTKKDRLIVRYQNKVNYSQK